MSVRPWPRKLFMTFVLVCVSCVGAATVKGQFSADLPVHLRTRSILRKAGQVSGILEELASKRQLFLEQRSMIDLFPALYYHSTETQLRNIACYDAGTAETVLDLIILFYDSFQHNRILFDRGGPGAVEKHWRKYYQQAAKLGKRKKVTASELVDLMLDGIDSHLADLPRSLRSTFRRMPITVDELKKHYFEMEGSFSKVSKGMNADLVHVNGGSAGILSADAVLGIGTKYVNLLRRRAWEEAVSSEKLKVSEPQPEIVHADSSRKYFSLLASSGCIRVK